MTYEDLTFLHIEFINFLLAFPWRWLYDVIFYPCLHIYQCCVMFSEWWCDSEADNIVQSGLITWSAQRTESICTQRSPFSDYSGYCDDRLGKESLEDLKGWYQKETDTRRPRQQQTQAGEILIRNFLSWTIKLSICFRYVKFGNQPCKKSEFIIETWLLAPRE